MRSPSLSTHLSQYLGLQVPPKKKTSRSPHLEHPLSHGRVDLKEIIPKRFAGCKGFLKLPFMIMIHFGPSHNWPFLLGPQKNAPKIKHFGGGDIQNIHQIFFEFSPIHCPKSKVGLRASARAIHLGFLGASNLPVSVVHLCVVYPTAPLKVVNIFSWKNFKTGSKMGSNRRSSNLFPRKSCSSVQVKDVLCPARWLEQCFVSILTCKRQFSRCADGGSIPRVRWNSFFIFILIQLHSASQLSTLAHFAVLSQHRRELLFLPCF